MKKLIAFAVIAGLIAGYFSYDGTGIPIPSKQGSDEIRKGIQKVTEEEQFVEGDRETRGRVIEQYLRDAAEEERKDADGNTIVPDSIELDEGNDSCIYTDTGGGINVIKYETDDSYMVEGTYDEPLMELTPSSDAKGKVLYALDDPGSSTAQMCEKLIGEFRDQGSECEFDDEVTVEDLKTSLSGNDYVVINTHGSMIGYGYGFANESSNKVPVICLDEEITDTNRADYAADISEQRIAKVTVIDEDAPGGTANKYWVMPSFFTKYYGDNGLEGTYVHMGCCYGFGGSRDENGGEDRAMADAFLSCGARAVTGYFNSVFTYYDYCMLSDIMSGLLGGQTLQEAVVVACLEHGGDDRDFANDQGWLDPSYAHYDKVVEKFEEGSAYLIIAGENYMQFAGSPAGYTEPEPEDQDETEGDGSVPDDYLPDEPDAEFDVVGLWIDEKRRNGSEDVLWDDSLEFFEDGTGIVALSGGAEHFDYTLAADGTVFATTTDREVEAEFMARINGNTLVIEYSDFMEEGKEFEHQNKWEF